MHLTTSWRRRVVGACAAALVLPLAVSAGSASAAASSAKPAAATAAIAPTAVVTSTGGATINRIVPTGAGRQSLFINSPAMGREVQVDLLLPPGYNPGSGARYPELHLLDGLRAPNTSSDWVNQGGAADFFRDKNVLVVMSVGGGGSFFQNWLNNDPGLLATDGTPNTKLGWETFLTGELPGIIDSPQIGGNGNRAVAGLSMGGFSAFNLTAKHPELYKAAASYSGYPDTQVFGLPQFLQYVLSAQVGASNPDNMWGPVDAAPWPANNPAVQIDKLKGKSLYMSAGTGLSGAHDTPLGFAGLSDNYTGAILEVIANYSSQSFSQKAKVTNLPVTEDLTHPGIHAWGYWHDQLVNSWPQLAGAIGGPTGCTVGGAIGEFVRNTPNQLGPCITNETPLAGHPGMLVQQFANGHVYYAFPGVRGQQQTIYFVQGIIDGRYQALGGPASFLGLPTNNEISLPGGAFSDFEGGHIYWSGATGAQVVKGAIFAAWGTQGWETGRLRYPTSEEFPINNGAAVQQNFQGGHIIYTWAGPANHPAVITYN